MKPHDPLLQAWHHAVEVAFQRERAEKAEQLTWKTQEERDNAWEAINRMADERRAAENKIDRAEAESARLTQQLADAINLGTEYLQERNSERDRIERMAEAVGDMVARAERAEHRADSAEGEVKRLADELVRARAA